jgi:hypothetical protein
MGAAESIVHPNPYASADLQAEFRSPRFRTYLMPAFWDGHGSLVIRFTPTEAGEWIYRLSGNLASLEGKQGAFHAAESNSHGFIKVANLRHWATDDNQPHLWMGYVLDRLAFLPAGEYARELDAAAANKFNHVRVSILGGKAEGATVMQTPYQPNVMYFDELDARLRQAHARGLTVDLVLASDPDSFAALMPDWRARERFIRYLVARYAPLNITWQGFEEFEESRNGRQLLKETGLAIKRLDPYHHPRSSNAKITSSPLLPDEWMDFVIEASTGDQVAAIERQLYQVPFVAITDAAHLWNATMDGMYPEFRGGNQNMAQYWFQFMTGARHWELEPYFDLDAGRAVALEDAEYIVYLEKPGPPVEVTVEKHGYDVSWFNPLTGTVVEQKKYKGEHFTGQAPDSSHPWVLSVAREGHLESMRKSYKFESRPPPVQEVEVTAQKVPFEITEPAPGSALAAGKPAPYSIKLKRETRATRSMMYLWTADVPAEEQGFRVIATGARGTLQIPAGLARGYPAVLTIRVTALNANGKAYSVDQVYSLTQ